MINLVNLLFLFWLAGCGLVTERSVYEGVRSIQSAQSPSTEPNSKRLPPYDQYEKERNNIRH
jgi:hypothetical protein